MSTLTVPQLSTELNSGSVPNERKRGKSVTSQMTEDQYEYIRKAADKQWPNAIMTDSSRLLSLALIAADQILKKPTK